MEIDKFPFNCYKCYVCTYKTTCFSLLNDHLNTHARTIASNDLFCCKSSLERYKCPHCNYESDLKVVLYEHVEEAHRGKALDCFSEYLVKIFTCKSCSFKTNCLLVFAAHTHRRTKQSSHLHKRNNYVGDESEQINDAESSISMQSERSPEDTFENSDEREEIVNDEPQNKWFKCDQCPYEAKWRRKLADHVVHKHTNQVNSELLKSARHQSELKDNPQLQEEPDNNVEYYHCHQCSFKAANKFFLSQHIMRKHTDETEIKWFKCAQCSYQSKFKHHLRQHIQNKHTHPDCVKWYRCSRCSRKFKQKRSVREHALREHTNSDEIKWFKCSQCSYKSKIRDYLVQHIQRVHLVSNDKNVKLLNCEHCSHVAKKKSNLKSHILSKHTVSMKKTDCFKCTLCSYQSNEERYLKQHVRRMHDGVKWHRCGYCSYKATKKRYLTNHVRCQHPEERSEYQKQKQTSEEDVLENLFKCAECPYESTKKRYFRQHQYRVHGNIWHQCEFCPYRVKKKCYLTNHILRQHSNPEEIQTEVQNM